MVYTGGGKMEVCMDKCYLLSKRMSLTPNFKAVRIPGTYEEVSLNRGELLLIPAFYMDRKIKDVESLYSYVVFNNVIIINDSINFGANLIVEVLFNDGDNLNAEINRFKIPFDGRLECSTSDIRRLEIEGRSANTQAEVRFPNEDKRLNGCAILKTSFDIDICARLQ